MIWIDTKRREQGGEAIMELMETRTIRHAYVSEAGMSPKPLLRFPSKFSISLNIKAFF